MRRLTKEIDEYVSNAGTSSFIERLLACCNLDNRSRKKEIDLIKSELSFTSQDQFYPIVAELFQQLGCDAYCGRTGDTSNRIDVELLWNGHKIPVEVKSPQEIPYHDVKSVRQALENKVVCLSRYKNVTSAEHTSLSIAYDYPNNRSNVHELIDDIYATFGIRVGLIDINDLMKSVIHQRERNVHWNIISNLLGRYDEAVD